MPNIPTDIPSNGPFKSTAWDSRELQTDRNPKGLPTPAESEAAAYQQGYDEGFAGEPDSSLDTPDLEETDVQTTEGGPLRGTAWEVHELQTGTFPPGIPVSEAARAASHSKGHTDGVAARGEEETVVPIIDSVTKDGDELRFEGENLDFALDLGLTRAVSGGGTSFTIDGDGKTLEQTASLIRIDMTAMEPFVVGNGYLSYTDGEDIAYATFDPDPGLLFGISVTDVYQEAPGGDVLILGVGFDMVEFFQVDTNGPNPSLRWDVAPNNIELDSSTQARLKAISIPGNIGFGNSITAVRADDDESAEWTGSALVEDVALVPAVSSSSSPVATRVHLEGTLLSELNHIELIGTFNNYSYFDPNGPDAASNPVTSGMRSNWDSNVIEFDDSQLGGETITAIHLYAVGDNPDYGIQDLDDFDIDSAPVVTDGYSNAPFNMTLEGTGFDWVNQIRYDDNITDLYYYDPDGPDVASNPGTATINEWSDTKIDIEDTARGGFHVSGNGSGPEGGRVLMEATTANDKAWSQPNGQQWHFPDYFVQEPVAAPTVGSFSSPEEDGITMSGGTLLDTVSRVRLFTEVWPSGIFIDPTYTEQDANHIRIGTGYGMGISGQTVNKVELWTGTFPGSLATTYDGLSILIEAGAENPPNIVDIQQSGDILTISGTDLDPADFGRLMLRLDGGGWVAVLGTPNGDLQVPTHNATEIDVNLTQWWSIHGFGPGNRTLDRVSFLNGDGSITLYDVDVPSISVGP